MSTNNYFAAVGHHFFFDGTSVEDTTRAFDLAREAGANLAVFRVPLHSGPWDTVAVVGHRQRGTVIFDIKRTKDQLKLFFLKEELSHLDREYIAAGRIDAVAA